jgi:hypothetical protein
MEERKINYINPSMHPSIHSRIHITPHLKPSQANKRMHAFQYCIPYLASPRCIRAQTQANSHDPPKLPDKTASLTKEIIKKGYLSSHLSPSSNHKTTPHLSILIHHPPHRIIRPLHNMCLLPRRRIKDMAATHCCSGRCVDYSTYIHQHQHYLRIKMWRDRDVNSRG